MLQPVVGGFSPEMVGLNPKLGWENPERNPWPKDHATTPLLDWENPVMNPWPKGHATTCSRWL
ncbi:hypothetical protein [Alteromonas sp. M12]|uniref:hypothetical protein n=1 Tax=Alteromonas sp. M12 TaxID=3135644 RepID=UPI00319E3DC7